MLFLVSADIIPLSRPLKLAELSGNPSM